LGGAAVLGALAVAIALLGWWLRVPLGRRLVGTACAPVVVPQLDMIELIALRKKTVVHRTHPNQPMLLSDREMSWVLTEQYRIPIELAADDAVVTARKPLLLEGGICGELRFTGEVSVERGVMRVRPERVRLGAWPLPLIPGREVDVDPLDLGPEGPAAARLVGAIESLEVREGAFRVRLSDMAVIP
ncbi:MAG: hypothetical protein H0V89_04535, partial [Deltaproteobacteria bacterium]|nr:hypothetical protein [Deltaproteobacteria bacterium]